MRILQANKYFYRRAGAEGVFLDTIDGLRSRGHEVAELAVADEVKNLPSEYKNYFIHTEAELTKKKMDALTAWKTFRHFISSREVDKKLRALVMATEPQVAHLHNVVHQMSATIFRTLKKMGVPIVLTAHDVQPMCPNHRMLVKGELCEKCFRHKYYNCTRYKCIGNSRLKSMAGSLEAYYYYLAGIWDMVDIFICPSQFMADKMAQWGFSKKKLRVINNFYQAPAEHEELGDKIVYLSRLHEEKGIKVFLAAARQLRDYQIIIAGDGPEKDWVDNQIRQYSLTHVKTVGQVSDERWQQVMSAARVVVVPSIFYENCSMSILEALGHGRLVVASDRGGNSELITTKQTGWLAEPGDEDSFVTFIHQAMEIGQMEAEQMINNGRRLVMDKYNIDTYFNKLEELYQEVISGKK